MPGSGLSVFALRLQGVRYCGRKDLSLLARTQPIKNTGRRHDSPSRHYSSVPLAEEDGSRLGPESSRQQEFADKIRPYYESKQPVIVRKAIRDWERIERHWKDYNYLMQRIGEDLHVDIEIGGAYNSDASEKLNIPFAQYVQYLNMWDQMYGDPNTAAKAPTEQILYLAQNELPTGLRNEIEIPALCQNEKLGVGNGRLYQVMLWMGPTGCVSPLHYDPLDNFLLQCVGKKRIRLIENSESNNQCLYVGKQYGQQENTCAVNLEDPDYNRFPKFQEINKIMEGELSPGDILFIPSKCWHHARSMEFSVSVNAWWR